MQHTRKSSHNDRNWVYVQLRPEQSGDGFEIHSDIRFGGSRSKKFDLKFGDVQLEFGFRRCELCFRIRNGRMPMKHRWPPSSDDVNVTVEEEIQTTEGQDKTGSLRGKTGSDGATLEAGASRSLEEAYSRSWSSDWSRVIAIGPDQGPKWKFRALGDGCLEAALSPNLGRLLTEGEMCKVTYWFEFGKNDVRMVRLEGLFDVEFPGRKKKGVLKRLVEERAKQVVFTEFGRRLSEGQIQL